MYVERGRERGGVPESNHKIRLSLYLLLLIFSNPLEFSTFNGANNQKPLNGEFFALSNKKEFEILSKLPKFTHLNRKKYTPYLALNV
jgi:hypothetical protein